MTMFKGKEVQELSAEEVVKKLIAYSEELGLYSFMDLDSLIESHKNVRAMNIQMNHERNTHWQEARELAYKHSLETAGEDFIHVEKLASMTMAEVANFIESRT